MPRPGSSSAMPRATRADVLVLSPLGIEPGIARRASSPRRNSSPGRRYEATANVASARTSVGVTRGPRTHLVTTCPRTHPVTWCQAPSRAEVPDIPTGPVEIVAVARESGHRSKIGVPSRVPGLNSKGACIGPIGQRVRNVIASCRREDRHIDYDEDLGRSCQRAVAAKGCRLSVHRRSALPPPAPPAL